MSTCCPQRLLSSDINMGPIDVNNNKLFTGNKEKTPLGSKFRRICMGTFLSRNSAETQHHLLKLAERHPEVMANMMKARLRMSEEI